MPVYLTDTDLWIALWPMLAAPIVIALLVSICLANPRTLPDVFRQLLIITIALGVLGMVTGNITGLSRTPAVGVVIPAVLGLIGGTVTYLIGTQQTAQLAISAGVIVLSINLLLGLTWGSRSRVLYEYASSSPEIERTKELADEDTNYIVALKRLKNEVLFNQVKSFLEKERNMTLRTQYGNTKKSDAGTPGQN